MTLKIIYIFLFVFFNLNCYKKSLTVSMTGIGRPCLLWGGAADSALHQNSMKEGTETQCYYLDVRIKMGVTCKYLAPNLYRKFKKSFERNSFWEKRLSLSQFLIFLVPLFGKQSHFDINNDFFLKMGVKGSHWIIFSVSHLSRLLWGDPIICQNFVSTKS